jgi:hypothetical protein
VNRWAGVRSWWRDRSVRWQRSGAVKDLERLGFEAEALQSLRAPDLLRLARWGVRPTTWVDRTVFFGMSLLIVVTVIDAAPDTYTGGVFPVLIVAALLGVALAEASGALGVWLNGRFDYYFEFGRAGGRIIRALERTDIGELSRKERAVRAAHAWSRTGRRGGVIFERRRERVFVLLARTPMDSMAAREICDAVRASMLDAVVGTIDPEEYQEPRRIWHEREHLEFLNLRITLIVTFIGLLAVIGFWPGS